ncbi:tRNA lysidine(34) synthetase TilS, partial [Streptomyces hainanensis]
MGPHPSVAAIRLAVRRVLHDILNEADKADDHKADNADKAPRPSSA